VDEMNQRREVGRESMMIIAKEKKRGKKHTQKVV
jgi:hypothetical protein